MPSMKRALPLVALIVPILVTGCGFSDQLTRRGFIRAGDSVCARTIVQTSVDLQQPGQSQNTSAATFLNRVSDAYGAAGRGFAGLAVGPDDKQMRERIVRRFASTARAMTRAARDTAAGDATGLGEGKRAFGALEAFAAELRNYGFVDCGGH
jgi:hypothetical protein